MPLAITEVGILTISNHLSFKSFPQPHEQAAGILARPPQKDEDLSWIMCTHFTHNVKLWESISKSKEVGLS